MGKLFLNQSTWKKFQRIKSDFVKYIYTSLLQNVIIIHWGITVNSKVKN